MPAAGIENRFFRRQDRAAAECGKCWRGRWSDVRLRLKDVEIRTATSPFSRAYRPLNLFRVRGG